MDMVALHEAKNRLTSIVREVEEGRTVELTRHGKPVAVLLGIEEYQRLCREEAGLGESLRRFYGTWGMVDQGEDPYAGLRAADPGRETGL